jgi:hypothetical protein
MHSCHAATQRTLLVRSSHTSLPRRHLRHLHHQHLHLSMTLVRGQPGQEEGRSGGATGWLVMQKAAVGRRMEKVSHTLDSILREFCPCHCKWPAQMLIDMLCILGVILVLL